MTEGQVRTLVDAYVFVIAACVGSFLNVVVARLPKGRSLVRPGSACPRCGSPIRWYDNIPIVSWIWLRGRCRNCALPISLRYPLVELLTAILALAIFHRIGLGLPAVGYSVFACALVALTFIDLDTWLLPHQITWPLLALGLASPLWNPQLRFVEAAVGALAGTAVFAAIALFGEKVLHRETMGWGDVYLLGAIGAWLGWQALLPVILLAAVQGSIVGGLLLWLKRDQRAGSATPARERTNAAKPGPGGAPAAEAAGDDDWVPPPHAVPFGPFLALAALEQLLFGGALEQGYFDLLERLWR
jgi:leader peptidase (prepilin peptidase) / N-methyltransferase